MSPFYILNGKGFLKVKFDISMVFLKRLTNTWATSKHDYNMRQISRLMPTYDNPPPPHRRSWPEGGDRIHTWVPGDPTAGPGKLAGYWPVGDNDVMCLRPFANAVLTHSFPILPLKLHKHWLFSKIRRVPVPQLFLND